MILKISVNVFFVIYICMVNFDFVREDRLIFRFLDDYVIDLLVLYNYIYVYLCKWNVLVIFGF